MVVTRIFFRIKLASIWRSCRQAMLRLAGSVSISTNRFELYCRIDLLPNSSQFVLVSSKFQILKKWKPYRALRWTADQKRTHSELARCTLNEFPTSTQQTVVRSETFNFTFIYINNYFYYFIHYFYLIKDVHRWYKFLMSNSEFCKCKTTSYNNQYKFIVDGEWTSCREIALGCKSQ